MNKVYISLGGSCCIAHQLRELKLRDDCYPFDWVRINNFNNIIKLLENNFSNFYNIEYVKKSDKFYVNQNNISYIYKNQYCYFYHEFDNYINDVSYNDFINKYQRRIIRLYNILKSNNEIIFIREDNYNIKESQIINFIKCIKKINNNIKFKFIIITNKNIKISLNDCYVYKSKKKIINWKRDELEWEKILYNH